MKYLNIFLSLIFLSGFTFAQNITSGLPFLKTGAAAALLAQGETYSVFQHENGGFVYNPAALPFSQKNQISFSNKSWIEDTKTNFLSAIITGSAVTAAVHLNSTNISNIEIRTLPGSAEGTFAAENFSAGISAGAMIAENLSAGITAKFLYEKIFIDEASGYGFDLGSVYTFNQHLSFGASLLNIGTMNKLRSEQSKLPTTLRCGGSYLYNGLETVTAIVNAEFVKTFDDNTSHVHFGTQFSYQDFAMLRAGIMTGYESRYFTTGLGIRYGIVVLDYSFLPFSNTLGTGHTFTLSFLL